MAANTNPIFTLTGNFLPVRLSAGNTASDGSGTIYTIVTAGTDGTRVDGVRFRNSQVAPALSTAMVHRIFLSGTAGTGHRLVGEVTTAAATRSNTVIGATSLFVFDQPIIMQPGQVMSVAQSAYAGAQDQFDAIAYASNY